MKKLIIASLLILPALVFAEFEVDPDSEWRVVEYGQIDLAATAEDGGVVMEWNAYPGEGLEWYKVLRSASNNNPVYPEDTAIGVKSPGELEMFDGKPLKSAYYRVCAITSAKQRSCSNVVWVESEISESNTDKKIAKHVAAKEKIEKMKNAHLQAKEQRAEKIEDVKEKRAEKKEVITEKKEAKKEQVTEKKEARAAAKFAKLEAWVERVYARLEASSLTNAQKIEKIEKLQDRLYAWGEQNERRAEMVGFLDEHFSKWIDGWSEGSDIEELDGFLDGLLDD